MAQNNSEQDPGLGTLSKLGLVVVIPVAALLMYWGVMPDCPPPSQNFFITE
jgi:hypothetical protein